MVDLKTHSNYNYTIRMYNTDLKKKKSNNLIEVHIKES